jgi:hypothetical protein
MKLEELKHEVLAEMANIRPKYHKAGIDIKFQIGQPGTWNNSGHGPRIKLFKKRDVKNITVIILDKNSNNIKVLESSYDKKLIGRSEVNDLITYFKKYRYAYLIMWLDVSLDVDDLVEMLDETDKDSDLIKQKFEILYNNL